MVEFLYICFRDNIEEGKMLGKRLRGYDMQQRATSGIGTELNIRYICCLAVCISNLSQRKGVIYSTSALFFVHFNEK